MSPLFGTLPLARTAAGWARGGQPPQAWRPDVSSLRDASARSDWQRYQAWAEGGSDGTGPGAQVRGPGRMARPSKYRPSSDALREETSGHQTGAAVPPLPAARVVGNGWCAKRGDIWPPDRSGCASLARGPRCGRWLVREERRYLDARLSGCASLACAHGVTGYIQGLGWNIKYFNCGEGYYGRE